jgi:alpha-D-ribose 1-methylphosphonate 5-triphosphate synthase subunit PhnH
VTAAPTLTPRAAREQQTFRVLLEAMARPGSINRLPLHTAGGDYASAISVIEALVDHEVTFAVEPPASDLIEVILRQTGGRRASPGEAEYVLTNSVELSRVLGEVMAGNIEQPDKGATVACLVAHLGVEAGAGEPLAISGPGIDGRLVFWAEGFGADPRQVFAERNADPPLGVDLILLTSDGAVTCLPRYTRLHEV